MDLIIAYKLQTEIETQKNHILLYQRSQRYKHSQADIIRESCSDCGQSPYFCQCYNNTLSNGGSGSGKSMVLSLTQ